MKNFIDAAQGKDNCDLIFRSVEYLDVFSAQWRRGDVSVVDGVIVGLDSGLKASQEISANGLTLVPGFIDAHVHVESSMMLAHDFQKAVLPKGTTTAICDPHEITNVVGPEGIQYFLESSESLSMDLWVMLSSCVPSSDLETNGAGVVSAETLLNLASHPHALGLAEMMDMPGVLSGKREVLDKLEAFVGSPIDGHAPMLRGKELSAYLSTGISSCHESSNIDEAVEKLQKGMSIWIREGSVAKDLDAIVPLLSLATSTSIGFCTDDRNPYDISQEGHIDHLVRKALAKGIPPEVVYRSASWTVARHYGIDRRGSRAAVGAIAPGYSADLVLLDDKDSCSIKGVFKSGMKVENLEASSSSRESSQYIEKFEGTMKALVPCLADLRAPEGQVNVIGVSEGSLLTKHEVDHYSGPGVFQLTVLERHGKGNKPVNAYVRGFGNKLDGAIASSVGHDSHNLIAVGSSREAIRIAFASLIESGGGFAVANQDKVLEMLELPYGGLMSKKSPEELSAGIKKLKTASRSIGCELEEPFLQLAFLSLPVIPELKLTDLGLVSVGSKEAKFISVGT